MSVNKALCLLFLPLIVPAADVSVEAITSQTELLVDSAYIPKAEIANLGYDSAASFPVFARIWEGSVLVYVDTSTVSLAPGEVRIISFMPFVPSSLGEYTLTVSAALEGDLRTDNNSSSLELTCGFCLGPDDYPEIDLEVRNLRGSGLVNISYVLFGGQLAELTIYDMMGGRIKSFHVGGIGSVDIDLDGRSGVFFARLDTDNETETRKIVILR